MQSGDNNPEGPINLAGKLKKVSEIGTTENCINFINRSLYLITQTSSQMSKIPGYEKKV